MQIKSRCVPSIYMVVQVVLKNGCVEGVLMQRPHADPVFRGSQ